MEGQMTFIAVVIIMSLGAPPFQLDDTLKPTGYDTPAECWLRTSVMIREVAVRGKSPMPVVSVSTTRLERLKKHRRKRHLNLKDRKSKLSSQFSGCPVDRRTRLVIRYPTLGHLAQTRDFEVLAVLFHELPNIKLLGPPTVIAGGI